MKCPKHNVEMIYDTNWSSICPFCDNDYYEKEFKPKRIWTKK